ncbi:hypothetical protein VPH35_045986 [Triticum aestivum]
MALTPHPPLQLRTPPSPPAVAVAHQRRVLLSPRRTRSCCCCAGADVGKVWARRAYRYDEIEPRWQARWEEHRTFRTSDASRPKGYILGMFPYPSFYASDRFLHDTPIRAAAAAMASTIDCA